MRRPLICFVAIALMTACGRPARNDSVEAVIQESCGPLDGSAFDLAIPDRSGRTIRVLQAPTAFDETNAYSIPIGHRDAGMIAQSCAADGGTCESATDATLELRRLGEGRYSGRIEADFPDAGERAIAFSGRARPMPDGVACG